MKGLTTKALHGAYPKKDVHGALRMPVYDNVAFEFETSKDLELAFLGKKPAHAYSRITNPTVEDFELRIKLIAEAAGVIAVSSGMAAISDMIITLCGAQSNIITTRYLFGNTISLIAESLAPWGLEVRYADLTDPDAVVAIIDENTKAVFVESITNPQLEVADIKALTEATAAKGVPTILDGTMTTPAIFKSKDFGVAVEIISTTKYISGGGTAVGGVIIDNGVFDWSQNQKLEPLVKTYGPFALIAKLRREVYRNLGSCLSPHNAALMTLGLETLDLRIGKSCENALEVAAFLQQKQKVKKVNYPGLSGAIGNEVACKQFGGRFGGLLTFDLASKDACFSFMDTLKLIRRATNLNDNKTLIIHPASTIFSEFSEEEQLSMGVTDTMIRLSVGIEDKEDLLADLSQGLESL